MSDEQKVAAALRKLGVERPLSPAMHLRDDLDLDSANLIELTVIVHSLYGVDLGRLAAEQNRLPATVGDLIALLATP